MATFLALKQRVYRRLGFADTPATEVSTRIGQYINDAHRQLLSMPGMDHLRYGRTTITTVANAIEYGLPWGAERIISMRDTTNDVTLQAETWQWYRAIEPAPADMTGNPEYWIPVGYRAVQKQPSDSSTIYIKSSSASDTTQKVSAEFVRDDSGYVRTLTFGEYYTLTGATAVSLGANIPQINKVWLDSAPLGYVTLWEDDATTGTLLATLPIGKTNFRFYSFALFPTPSSAVTLAVDYIRGINDMSYDEDEPFLPEDFHDILATGARMMEYEKQDDTRYGIAKAEWDKRVADLKWFVGTQTDSRHTIGVSRGGSRLGPWYPRGT